MATEQQVDELHGKFQDTEEMRDWDEFVTGTKKVLATNPAVETVTVPAGFLRRVILDIGTSPLMFTAYRDRFNQLCEELGMPEEKRGERLQKIRRRRPKRREKALSNLCFASASYRRCYCLAPPCAWGRELTPPRAKPRPTLRVPRKTRCSTIT